MISVEGITKRFGDRTILDNVSFSLPNSGVIAIVGESGSGKTTLLNLIAGLDFDYEGQIYIDSTDLRSLNKDALSDYRIHYLGYIFQNFNLLNLESAETNISLPLDCVCNYSKDLKRRKIAEIASLLNITKLLKENVNKLSGGEKQRVAIARAMINSPKLILCDEPTGALDEENSQQIYDILKKISSNSLIIIASHDIKGVSEIANQILTINDGKIIIKENKYHRDNESLSMPENKRIISKASLPLFFKIKHSFQKLKTKKFRSLITHTMLSLSLTGIGLSILLSSSVTKKINEAFSNLIKGNQIVVSLKQENQNSFNNAYSAPLDRIQTIKEKYAYYVEGVGANYLVNFEDFFKDDNSVYVEANGHKVLVPSLSARSVNDFRWLDDNEKAFYPESTSNIQDDEVVIGLTYADMVNVCFNLQILRSFESLGEYIKNNEVTITLSIENSDWQYADEQIFSLKGVTESNKSIFYHSNQLWNEAIFEKSMMIPSDDDTNHKFPWEMLKIYYLKTLEESKVFLDKALFDAELNDFVFERTNFEYNPLLCEPGKVCDENRLYVYLVDKVGVSPYYLEYISQLDSNIKNYYFNSDYGYASYSSNIMSGFAKNIFISMDKDKIDASIDADNELSEEANISLELPSDVVQGNFLNGVFDGVRFSSRFDKLIAGRIPQNNNEIVISSGLAKRIDPEGIGIGKYAYIAGEINEYLSDDNHLIKDYSVTKVAIVGLINEEKNFVYHDNLWTISFFRDKLGVSSFALVPKSAVIELDEKVDPKPIIERFSKMFHEYNFSSPINDLSKSVDSTLEYANAILIGFSMLSTFISILLLGTVVLLNVLESKDEIELLKVIGIKDKDIKSMFVTQSLLQGLVAFLISAIELVVVDVVISKALGDTLSVSLSYSINLFPFAVVFLFAIFLPIIISYIIVRFFQKKSKIIAKSQHNC